MYFLIKFMKKVICFTLKNAISFLDKFNIIQGEDSFQGTGTSIFRECISLWSCPTHTAYLKEKKHVSRKLMIKLRYSYGKQIHKAEMFQLVKFHCILRLSKIVMITETCSENTQKTSILL